MCMRLLSTYVRPSELLTFCIQAIDKPFAARYSPKLGAKMKTLPSLGYTIATVLSLLLPAIPGFGQAVSTVQIYGVVQDASGALIPGARVTATHTLTGLVRTTVTGADGEYAITQLPVGP